MKSGLPAGESRWVPLAQHRDVSGGAGIVTEVFAASASDAVACYDLLIAAGIDAAWEPFDPRDAVSSREMLQRTFTLLVHPEDLSEARALLASLEGDDADLGELADEQYLSPWVGAERTTGESDDDASPSGSAQRTGDGAFTFTSDTRPSAERTFPEEGEPRSGTGVIGWAAVAAVVVIVLIALSDFVPDFF